MKIYKSIIILFFAAATFVACEEALTLEPEGNTSASGALESLEDFEGRWAKLYAGLIIGGQQGGDGAADIQGIDGGFSNYSRLYWKLQQLTTDEAIIAWNDGTIKDLHWQVWTPENEFIGAMFARLSYQVTLANAFIREANEDALAASSLSNGEQEIVRGYVADARFLRAYSYYHGLDLFGTLPFTTEDTAEDGSELPEFISGTDLFNYIESELLDVVDELPSGKGDEYGRVSEAAAQMLLAKLYLNAEVYTGQERYEDALRFTNAVIDQGYSIDTDLGYEALFLADNDSNGAQDEFIWTLNYDGNNTQTFGGTTFLSHAPVGGQMDPADYGLDFGWGGIRTTPEFVELFDDEEDSEDGRANFFTSGQDKSIENVGDFQDGFAIVKFQNVNLDGTPGVNPTFVSTDFPVFRLADAYLMYAELVVRGAGGDEDTAVDYINIIRERAFGDDDEDDYEIDEDDLSLEFILDERSRELHWEAHRRQDLKRFNQFTTNGVWEWKGNVQNGVTTPAFRNLFPIPTTELNLNSNLVQNPGY
ncbi:RagB/SusD family nutrient uptake outer membrane protein [Nonlabens ponticola]|uniref:RagB/SusD family nutrient uptake outer membrane protein n=1 Tax=Nonlabens ponticola TaxID=2496866 RepID=A0A3S9MWC5_9FLAO|nr:RagB/SusD family nutrient uptake outer membrane protein [Nonlabens ponticola]AZQ43525.1 RagB/SusD family nutrient uptake outer membrane protein [Nonlabens ponticola]